jgi:shikimate dehydrogenase
MSSITLRGAVIGSPITHSLSPLLHREAFAYLGIAATYDQVEVGQGELTKFFQSHSDDFDYLSMTMPLKEEALSLNVCIDALSTRVQTANTLYKSDGEWHLTSTDGQGFIESLTVQGYSTFQSVLVLGAGGTARAVVGALDSLSANITVLGRTSTRKSTLESAITESNFEYLRWSDSVDFSPYDLVVNTTPAGAADLIADSIPSTGAGLFFDIIYKPWPTLFASRWRDSGGQVISGLEMLLYQGIAQLELVLGHSLDHEALAQHLRPKLLNATK